MIRKRWATQMGFTIVELLMVIVVIAILASITIVAYNGIQQRARATRTLAVANSYIKGLQMYVAQYGVYPLAYSACLGDTNPDTNGDGKGDCGTNGDTVESSVLNAELKKVISPLPAVDQLNMRDGSNKITGIRYHYDAAREVDGQIQPLMVLYYLEGSAQDCGRGDVAQDLGSKKWKIGVKYTYTTADKTSCYVPISGPAS